MGASRAFGRYATCAAAVTATIWVFFSIVRVNATTVALVMLLLVLGAATYWGLREAIFTSIACVLGFNYYFLPPVGTFTVADPQNWVALGTFLISAVITSQLSTRAKLRAREAAARGSEVERLYRLSRAMLMHETPDIVQTALLPAIEIFGLRDIAFYDLESARLFGSRDDATIGETSLARVANSNESSVGPDFAIVPVHLGTRIIGALGFTGKSLTAPEQDSLANLVAINYERIRALNRASASEAARRGDEVKTFLLDGIAHDLKTPLTAIKTCVTTLILFPPEDEERRAEMLSIIDEETERVQRTITEAIQLTRIESDKIALAREVLQVRDVVERIVTMRTDSDRISVSIPADLAINADPELMEQALRQLIENAAKYSLAPARIEITGRREDGEVSIEVRDRGLGISPNELERIFEKFQRGTRGRSSVAGTGMGLAIAKGIIEVHGGSIRAANRPGGGAVFSCRFPTHEHIDDSRHR